MDASDDYLLVLRREDGQEGDEEAGMEDEFWGEEDEIGKGDGEVDDDL